MGARARGTCCDLAPWVGLGRAVAGRRVVKPPQTKNVAARGYVAERGRNETSLR